MIYAPHTRLTLAILEGPVMPANTPINQGCRSITTLLVSIFHVPHQENLVTRLSCHTPALDLFQPGPTGKIGEIDIKKGVAGSI